MTKDEKPGEIIICLVAHILPLEKQPNCSCLSRCENLEKQVQVNF